MRVRLVEKLDNLNEFFQPVEKFKDWSVREDVVDRICEIIKTSGYDCIHKGQKGFYIMPKTNYLVRMHFDFDEDDVCKVNLRNYRGKEIDLEFPLGEDDDLTREQLDKIYKASDNLILKVKNILSEANIFTKMGRAIRKGVGAAGNALNKATAKSDTKKYAADLVNKMMYPQGLVGEVSDVNVDNHTFDIDISRKGGDNFILGVSLKPDPYDDRKLIVNQLLGCRDGDSAADLIHTENLNSVQKVLNTIGKPDALNIRFDLNKDVAKATGSTKAEVKAQAGKFDDASGFVAALKQSTLNPTVGKYITEELNEDLTSDADIETLLSGKDPESGESIKLTTEDIRALVRYFIYGKVGTPIDNAKLTGQALDMLIKDIQGANWKVASYDKVIPNLHFVIDYLKGGNAVGSKILTVLSENPKLAEAHYRKSEDDRKKSFLADPLFWKSAGDNIKEVQTLVNLLDNLSVKDLSKFEAKNDADEEKLTITYDFDAPEIITFDKILKDKGGKYRPLDDIKSIIKLLGISKEEKSAAEPNNLRGDISNLKTVEAAVKDAKENGTSIRRDDLMAIAKKQYPSISDDEKLKVIVDAVVAAYNVELI